MKDDRNIKQWPRIITTPFCIIALATSVFALFQLLKPILGVGMFAG